MRYYITITVIFALNLFHFCSDHSTSNLLNGNFIEYDIELQAESSAFIESKKAFIITVTAVDNNTDDTYYFFDSPLEEPVASGLGTVTVTDIEPWNLGVSRIFLSYETNVPVGSQESINLEIKTKDGRYKTVTGNITVNKPLVLDHFEIQIPSQGEINTAFDITITAKDKTGNTFESFNAPEDDEVFITATTSTGIFTVNSPASGFTNGVLTVQGAYSTAVLGLKVKATLASDPAVSGLSNSMNIQTAAQVSLANFRVMAVPLAADSIRINWTKIPQSYNVKVEEETSPGNFTQTAYFAGTRHYYYASGLSASSAHTYRVTVYDSSDNVLLQGNASATTLTSGGCAVTYNTQTISTTVDWTVAGGPYCVEGAVTFDGGRLNIEQGSTVLMSTAGQLVFQNGAEFIPGDAGTGLTVFTSSDTGSPPAPHQGITLDSTASGTTFVPATANYSSGSVIRHIYYEYGEQINVAVPILVDDVLMRQNLNRALFLSGSTNYVQNATFQNNSITGSSLSGGAISGNNSTFIDYSIFEYNSANPVNTAGQYGGGAVKTCNKVENSFFLGNTTTVNGGALHTCSSYYSVFTENYAVINGGAQYDDLFSHNYYYKNWAQSTGGAVHARVSNLNYSHNYFEENHAGSNGGAFYTLYVTSVGSTSNITSRYNYYLNNTSDQNGAAIFLDDSSPGKLLNFIALNDYYYGNIAQGEAAVYHNYVDAADSASITDSVFQKASGDLGIYANVRFVIPLTVTNSYFENGASNCTDAFIYDAQNDCATSTFKTDAPYAFCADVSNGVTDPAGCVGPNWDKPQF